LLLSSQRVFEWTYFLLGTPVINKFSSGASAYIFMEGKTCFDLNETEELTKSLQICSFAASRKTNLIIHYILNSELFC
jgi:hypothetical protein